jgi:hypothetical protein
MPHSEAAPERPILRREVVPPAVAPARRLSYVMVSAVFLVLAAGAVDAALWLSAERREMREAAAALEQPAAQATPPRKLRPCADRARR